MYFRILRPTIYVQVFTFLLKNLTPSNRDIGPMFRWEKFCRNVNQIQTGNKWLLIRLCEVNGWRLVRVVDSLLSPLRKKIRDNNRCDFWIEYFSRCTIWSYEKFSSSNSTSIDPSRSKLYKKGSLGFFRKQDVGVCWESSLYSLYTSMVIQKFLHNYSKDSPGFF